MLREPYVVSGLNQCQFHLTQSVLTLTLSAFLALVFIYIYTVYIYSSAAGSQYAEGIHSRSKHLTCHTFALTPQANNLEVLKWYSL